MKENRQQIVEAVQRMQDCIVDNLDQSLSLEQLSRAAGYSPWHAARAFKRLTGKSPLAYIRALRLSRAALVLRDGRERIVDVALDFCFDSQEGFTRAFSDVFGTTPARYRKRPSPIPLFMPYRVLSEKHTAVKGEKEMESGNKYKERNGLSTVSRSDDFTGNMEDQVCADESASAVMTAANTVFVQVVERPARKLLLLRGIKADNYYDYCEEVGCEVWGMLCSVKEALYEPVGLWLPENLRKAGTGEYAQGVEVPVSYAGAVPDGYDLIDLPACKLMVFQGPPYKDEDFEEAIGSLWEVMKRYDPVFYGFRWADADAPRIQLEPQGERGYMEARPVRPV